MYTDVFTIITTKDQSGGMYNSFSTGGQGFIAVSKQTIVTRRPKTEWVQEHIRTGGLSKGV